jgi:hypothetical protein
MHRASRASVGVPLNTSTIPYYHSIPRMQPAQLKAGVHEKYSRAAQRSLQPLGGEVLEALLGWRSSSRRRSSDENENYKNLSII